jgi:hypothetical protein
MEKLIKRHIYVRVGRARDSNGSGEKWDSCELSPTINLFDQGDVRAVTLVVTLNTYKKDFLKKCIFPIDGLSSLVI